MRLLALAVVAITVAGCGSRPPVPVVDSRPPVVVEGARGSTQPAGTVPRDGRVGGYIVKKGDTLYRIAQTNKVSVADILAWNGLTDGSKIEIGQELRMAPPAGSSGVEVRPISSQQPIVVVSENGSTGTAANASTTGAATNGVSATVPTASTAGTGTQVRQPKGGKLPYSDAAMTEVRAMEGTPAQAAPATKDASPATPPVAAGDRIEWTWPSAGKVIRMFGKSGTGELSRGIDISGRRGEPIQVAGAGTVKYVGNLKDYGDFVVVHHAGDYLSVYAHTDKILVKPEQVVAKGQKIAEVGSSGTDQPKLHFEIRYKGEPVDPLKFLPERQ